MYNTGLVEKAKYITETNSPLLKPYWQDENDFFIENVEAIKFWQNII